MTKPSPTAIPLSLYIHIPWCLKKCPYCDFNSHSLREDLPESLYVDHLKQELRQKLRLIENRPINTIFIGGGTPSLFSGAAYATLLHCIRNSIGLTTNAEITLEANPGTVEQQRFQDYRQAGINRLSLGVQSLQDSKLAQLGRIHTANTALTAINSAKQAGFENINVDLMFGLSKQSIEEALQDLRQVIALDPRHVSWYQLTLEPNTLFYKQPPPLPDDDTLWEMQLAGQTLLDASGYKQYEISAYSQGGAQCQHNLNYWLFGDYLGIGAGAHSKITLEDGRVIRHSNTKHPKRYLNAENKISDQKTLGQSDLVIEFMLNALRLSQQIPLSLFTERTGLAISALEVPLAAAHQQGFLSVDNGQIIVNDHGKRYLNELLMLF